MFLQSIASAVPPCSFTQADCWEIIQQSPVKQRLDRRTQLTLRTILRGESGVQTRHFAVPEIGGVFDLTADQLNAAFRAEAPKLAARALAKALEKSGSVAEEIDALLICTCTGYLCPGVSSYVSELLGLRPNVFLQDLVGLGCGAAIPTLRAAQAVLAAQPHALVACVAVEICSAAFYLDEDPGVIISACLFSDGAAATLWRSTPGISVPSLAAGAVSQLYAATTATRGARPIARVIAHPGGRDVLNALETALPEFSLASSRSVLRNFGNMSSPSVLFALEEALRGDFPDRNQDWWMVSFGAGFSAHGCRIGLA